ncbi:MAG: LptF/LptG family permease [Bacteroidaceae bacterium]|nr:LptF/LptG family permease [Bacteroidaceae bacterium]
MKFPDLHIKKLDWFIIKSFLLLFSATFFICTFIFIMQFLWRWVDEFVGKGLDMWVMAQFFYLGSLTMIGQSLPLAILLAALMTFGNFGERLELLSMKAAGIPLLRIMAPLVVVCSILGCISFYFQNVVGPKAQVKLYTVLYSIKQTSPEVEIPEGVFYDQIEGYNLFVKKKNKETGMLYRVMIYDMTQGFENASIIVSDSGQIKSTADQQHLMLKLYNGERFANATELHENTRKKNIPYTRETFREKVIVIEFGGGFDMKDGSFLKKQAASKNILELNHSIDSLTHYNDSIGRNNWKAAMRNAYPQKLTFTKSDSLDQEREKIYAINSDSLYDNYSKQTKLRVKKAALNKVEQLMTDFEIKKNIMRSLDKDLNKHYISWWQKITLSLSCVIFFFIGAPLGAIVKKGGLGYPVLISVAIFLLYYIFNTSGEKMVKESEWYTWFGCLISTMVLTPLGVIFTYQSNKDSTIFNMDAYKAFFRKLLGLRESRNITLKEVIIEDPDYTADYKQLEEISHECRELSKIYRIKRLPNPIKVFFSENETPTIEKLSEKLEKLIEEMGNSKNRKIIQLLNIYPIMMTDELRSPFTKRWLNILSIIIFPIGILIYLRVYKFHGQISRDLKKIRENSRTLMERMIKEKLV